MRKALVIIAILAVVALAVGVIGPRLLRSPEQEPGPAVLGEASAREDQTLITARGVVVPVRWVKLSFPISGQLEDIQVTTGMTVTEGQVLATLDRQELELQVQLAESELATQEAHLAQLSEGGSQAEVEAARASHAAALATLAELRAGPSAQAMALAEADLLKAQKTLQRAQAAYDAVSSLPNIGARPESVQLEQATIDYERAKAAYELAVSGPSTAELKQAESQVASAAAHLAALTEARPSEIQAAEAAVTRAKIGLQQARLMLEQATLVAPFGSTATSVAELHAGDMVSPGTVIVTLADLSELHVEVTDLDEWGAANLSVDQTADLIVPALDNRSVRGRVTFVANEPTERPSGAIFYKALIGMDRQEPGLRWGNSVRVRLYVAGAKGVGFR